MTAIANSTLLRQPLMSPIGAIIPRGSVWEMRLQRQQENLTDISVGGEGSEMEKAYWDQSSSLLHLFPHLFLLSRFPAAATSAMRTCLISATDEWASVLTQKRSAPDGRGWRNSRHEGNETQQHGPLTCSGHIVWTLLRVSLVCAT